MQVTINSGNPMNPFVTKQTMYFVIQDLYLIHNTCRLHIFALNMNVHHLLPFHFYNPRFEGNIISSVPFHFNNKKKKSFNWSELTVFPRLISKTTQQVTKKTKETKLKEIKHWFIG